MLTTVVSRNLTYDRSFRRAENLALQQDRIDLAFFKAMKPEAISVNIGRGETVDTDAPVAALLNEVDLKRGY